MASVRNMAGGPASHPCKDISESKDDFGGRLHSCHQQNKNYDGGLKQHAD